MTETTGATQAERDSVITWLGDFAKGLQGALNLQAERLRLEGDALTNLVEAPVTAFTTTLKAFSVQGLYETVEGFLARALAVQSIDSIDGLLQSDGGLPSFDELAGQYGFPTVQSTIYSGPAFQMLTQVMQGGRDAYLALASSQVQALRRQAAEADLLLNNQIRACSQMIEILESLYGDSFLKLLDTHRRVAISLLRRAEQAMNTVADTIEGRDLFDAQRYSYGMRSVEGAQASLAAGAREDPIQARGLSSRRQEPTSSALGIIKDLVTDDDIDRILEDVREDLRLAGDDTVDDDEGVLPFDVPAELAEPVRKLADLWLAGLELSKDFLADGSRLLLTHRNVHQRMLALFNMEAQLTTASQNVAHVGDEVRMFAERLARLRDDMEATATDLNLMRNMPLWMVRLASSRSRMESTITPATLAHLTDVSEQTLYDEAIARIIDALQTIALDDQATVQGVVEEGNTLVGQFQQALVGRAEVPEGLILRVRAYRARLAALRRKYNGIQHAVASARTYRHDAVDAVDEYIEAHSPLLDGLRALIDGGHWATIGQFNATLFTQAGLIDFYMRKALFGAVLPPSVRNAIDRLLDLLGGIKRQAEDELATRTESNKLLSETIGQEADALTGTVGLIDTVATTIDEFGSSDYFRRDSLIGGRIQEETGASTYVYALRNA